MTGPKNGNAGIHYSSIELRSLGDVELVSILRGGCEDALLVFFERYSALVFHIARNIVKDEWEAEETVQQVFFDMYRAIDQFNPERGTLKTWLLQFAYHRSINWRERLIGKKFYDSQELNDGIFAKVSERSRHSCLSPPENTRFLEQMLARLKPLQKNVIELTFYEGLTAEEIAEKVGETPVVVRNNLYRGLAKLRCILIEDARSQPGSSQREGERKGIFVAQPRPL